MYTFFRIAKDDVPRTSLAPFGLLTEPSKLVSWTRKGTSMAENIELGLFLDKRGALVSVYNCRKKLKLSSFLLNPCVLSLLLLKLQN